MTETEDEYLSRSIQDMPIGNLIILVQKLAKKANYVKPAFRTAILNEAARRLSAVNNLARELRDDD